MTLPKFPFPRTAKKLKSSRPTFLFLVACLEGGGCGEDIRCCEACIGGPPAGGRCGPVEGGKLGFVTGTWYGGLPCYLFSLIRVNNNIGRLPGIQMDRNHCPRQLEWPQRDLAMESALA